MGIYLTSEQLSEKFHLCTINGLDLREVVKFAVDHAILCLVYEVLFSPDAKPYWKLEEREKLVESLKEKGIELDVYNKVQG